MKKLIGIAVCALVALATVAVLGGLAYAVIRHATITYYYKDSHLTDQCGWIVKQCSGTVQHYGCSSSYKKMVTLGECP